MMCKNAEGVFDDPSCPGESIIEYPLLRGEVSLGMRFHHPDLEGKSIITNYEVGGGLVVTWKWIWIWHANAVTLQRLLQGAVVEDARVRVGARRAHIHPEELILGIH